MTKEEIGLVLKGLRISCDMTQKEVADKIGRNQPIIGHWETGYAQPDANTLFLLCDIYGTTVDEAFGFSKKECNISSAELQHIEKYRVLDARGKSHVDSVLQWESERMEELQTIPSTVVEFHRPDGNDGRFLKYFRSASAGTGVFILGNEVAEQIAVPNTPESRQADFAIKISGDSMLPDYEDGDIVMVSQKAEMNHGDVGIFIVNNNVYIKEYGETELVSRNPASENIQISEYDNIVCMGKVIGKIPVVS